MTRSSGLRTALLALAVSLFGAGIAFFALAWRDWSRLATVGAIFVFVTYLNERREALRREREIRSAGRRPPE